MQNLLALRFANFMFEPLWNARGIRQIQITVAESDGVGGRGGYYNTTGALRDMLQNHMLQLLCLVAMEPPVSMRADDVRDEKVKVLRSLSPIIGTAVENLTVRGQYVPGNIGGKHVPGFAEDSGGEAPATETFVALRAGIDNWRWAGVPFFLRTGKRMPHRYTEIYIEFHPLPHSIFVGSGSDAISPNQLIIRLQPEETIRLTMMNKVPGLDTGGFRLKELALNLNWSEAFQPMRRRIAYERLFLDLFDGNSPHCSSAETKSMRPGAGSTASWRDGTCVREIPPCHIRPEHRGRGRQSRCRRVSGIAGTADHAHRNRRACRLFAIGSWEWLIWWGISAARMRALLFAKASRRKGRACSTPLSCVCRLSFFGGRNRILISMACRRRASRDAQRLRSRGP